MKHEELAAILAEPTTPPMRDALRDLPPQSLESLAVVADEAAEQGWRRVVIDPVRAGFVHFQQQRLSGNWAAVGGRRPQEYSREMASVHGTHRRW
ncbi:hypothetical protein ACFVWP_32620 [Streptomyces sp. NPDC058175]|uniref:hypothetical protein n=1 Tax=Streptomyces sp. NPDC058175 TaxID=3346367 RepID=UPI0036EB4428